MIRVSEFELAQRLVEDQQLRIVDQCARQRRALRHAARKLVRISVGEPAEPDQAQSIFDAFAMGAQQPACLQPERNIAPNRPPRIKRGVLKDDDARGIGPFDRLALYKQTASAWRVEPRDQPQQSRLAAPARPEQGDELAAADAQADPVQYRQRLSLQVETMAHFTDRERCSADRIVIYRMCPFRRGGRDYHRTKPFCQDSSRSRRRNSSVISPEHKRAMINSAAYMLA